MFEGFCSVFYKGYHVRNGNKLEVALHVILYVLFGFLFEELGVLEDVRVCIFFIHLVEVSILLHVKGNHVQIMP